MAFPAIDGSAFGHGTQRIRKPEEIQLPGQGAHVAFNGMSTLFPGGKCAEEPKTV